MKKLLYILLLTPLFFISSCEEDEVHGCLDSQACNYNPEATHNDGSVSCEYPVVNYDCNGVCIDEQACNFGLTEQCQYLELGYDCEGNITEIVVGMLTEGGIVFYIDETGEHGLVAALEDLEGQYEWGCYGTSISGADGIAIGTGYQNTMDIVAGCSETPIAASEALAYESEGYSDWYLPSIDELDEMYNTIGNGGTEGNIGGFTNNWYWSSSESSYVGAWGIGFSSGDSYGFNRVSTSRVRAVRSF